MIINYLIFENIDTLTLNSHEQGKVFVQFVVEKDGSVSNIKVVRSVSPSIDAEAVRVVRSLPKWRTPGYMKGEPVRVSYTIPINFYLEQLFYIKILRY